MIVATHLLTDHEREVAVAAVPWGAEIESLTGRIRAALDNQSVDIIEAAIGPGEIRAALVALYESADAVLQGSVDLAESVAAESYFKREIGVRPLSSPSEPLSDGSQLRFPLRLARYAVESAAVRMISGADHAANAYVRFAWEANVLHARDAARLGLSDPSGHVRWKTLRDIAGTLRGGERGLIVNPLHAFCLTEPLLDVAVASEPCRVFRDAVIHRERPSYRETPSLGRTTRWIDDEITVQLPRAEATTGHSIDEVRSVVADAGTAATRFIDQAWAFAKRWLASESVIVLDSPGEVGVTTRHPSRAKRRERRDPGPWLVD